MNTIIILIMMILGLCPKADLDGDCRVDMRDFAIFAQEWLAEGDEVIDVKVRTNRIYFVGRAPKARPAWWDRWPEKYQRILQRQKKGDK